MPAASLRCCPLRLTPDAPSRTRTDREHVSGSLISTRSPRTAAAESGSDFTNASTRPVISFSDSLPASGPASTATTAARPRNLRARSGTACSSKKPAEFSPPAKSKDSGGSTINLPGTSHSSRLAIPRQGSGPSESRSQLAAGPLPPSAVKTERPKTAESGTTRPHLAHRWTSLGSEPDKNSVAERSDDFIKIKSGNSELELDDDHGKESVVRSGSSDEVVDDGFANVLFWTNIYITSFTPT